LDGKYEGTVKNYGNMDQSLLKYWFHGLLKGCIARFALFAGQVKDRVNDLLFAKLDHFEITVVFCVVVKHLLLQVSIEDVH